SLFIFHMLPRFSYTVTNAVSSQSRFLYTEHGGMIMDMNYISPYIRCAWDDTIEAPFEIEERVLYDYELLYMKEGEIKVSVEGKEYHGIPGDIFLFKPMEAHSIKS